MKSWIIHRVSDLSAGPEPLRRVDIPIPEPQAGQLLIKVSACGVCHTEIDEIEGRTPPPVYPVIPGHQVIGNIIEHRGTRNDLHTGDRVGVAWIYSACGKCEFCLSQQENLCQYFRATGRDVNGGYAEYMVADENYVYPVPEIFSDAEAAPLLCAGAIGYRSVSLCSLKDGDRLGLTGFGASGHLVLKLVKHRYPHTDVYVFARSKAEREFALQLGNLILNRILLCLQRLKREF